MSKLHEKDDLILRSGIGNASDPKTGLVYEMTTTLGDISPLVKSMKTGRTFHLAWTDIIELAIEAGIDEEPEACVESAGLLGLAPAPEGDGGDTDGGSDVN